MIGPVLLCALAASAALTAGGAGYRAEIESWRAEREAGLKADDG